MLTSKSSIFRSFWLYGCAAGLFLAIFSAYPQIKLQTTLGDQWQGHYAYNDIDEVAYAAYLKALIDGRPRKNDPYTGRDHTVDDPQPESLFSIQFAAPYTIAVPARIFGISAPTAMTLAGVIAAFLTALMCFVLVRELSGHTFLAFSGSLFVLCGGALFAGEGAIGEILGIGFPYPYFPFLRRYVPAVPFPVFFFFLFAVWKLIRADTRFTVVSWVLLSTAAFSFLVFSYFYIWTTAAAWLACLLAALLAVRHEGWKQDILKIVGLGAACLIPLAVYAYMLTLRGESMDTVQLLVETRSLDLNRMPLIIGLAVTIGIVMLAILKVLDRRSRMLAFAAATGFAPIVLFNQQVVTGMSLQPIHYQVFIGNYVAGLAVVLLAALLIREAKKPDSKVLTSSLTVVALISLIWGFVECHFTVRVLDDANIARDRGFAVGRILAEQGAITNDPARDTVFAFTNIYGDDSPTIAPQNVLWARHQHVFAGLSWKESKERFYRQLYYRDLGPEWLDGQLNNGNFVAMIALFGWGRHTNRLSSKASPLTKQEIDDEVARFRLFSDNFGSQQAYEPSLVFMVIPTGANETLDNLSIWYSKELLEEAGGYQIFRLRPNQTKK